MAISLVAVAASAQQDKDWDMGGQVRFTERSPEPAAPGGVKKQAEDAVRAGLRAPTAAEFRDVGTQVVSSVRRGPFDDRIPGPVSIVCGRYAARDASGAKPSYAWFFVPIKHSKILWTVVDAPSDAQGDAYLSCKNTGLAN
ncbi:MAG TPA: hypothetical protein VGF50_14460 [Caulobacteraceae bacterium]